MKKSILLIIIFLISTEMLQTQEIVMHQTTAADMQKLAWIIDRWVSANGESTSYEHWERTSDTLFTGGSETVKNGDTVFSEKLKIVYEEGNFYYIADVAHNPAPVKFKATYLTDGEAVFENPEHDFPKKITYKQVDGNLHASIEGPGKSGAWRKVDFIMNKMK